VSIETDTDCIKAELRDVVARTWEQQKLINRVLPERLEKAKDTIDECRWILKFITLAEAGQKLDWIESELRWLEEDGSPKVRPHIVKYAIALAKQAIANQTPSLV
jgi:hypothetical protein